MTKIVTAAALGLLATAALVRNTPAPPGPDESERRLPMVGDRATRFAGFTPDSYSAEARTVEAVLSSGAAVRRWCFTEELAVEEGAVDLTRVTNGLVSLLDTHNQYEIDAVLGTVSSVRIENGQLIGLLHFADTDRGREAEARVSRGELRGVSIGYRVTKWEITSVEDDHETWRATAWELLEVSLVSVPADAAAGVRSALGNSPGSNEEEDDMRRNLPGGAAAPATPAAVTPAPAPAALEARSEAPTDPAHPAQQRRHALINASMAITLTEQARTFGDTVVTRANDLIAQNEADQISPDQVRASIMEAAADAQRARSSGLNAGPSPIVIPSAQFQARAAAVGGAILNLIDPSRYALDDNSRAFQGQSMRTLARAHLEAGGTRTEGLSDVQVAQQVFMRSAGMHTTSDFPNILGNTVRRTLRDGYQLAPRTFQQFARRARASDFRPITRVALADAPELKQVDEHGEYTYGSVGDSAETYRLIKYGRIFAVTWETIVNDDLDALGRIPSAFGMKAAIKENEIVWGILIDNPTMADGYALFSTEHGNLAGSGAGVSDTTLAAGRLAMRKQTSPQGGKMSLSPSLLLVGPEEETNAEKYTSSAYVPAVQSNVTPQWQRSLGIITDAEVENHAWFLAANPNTQGIDTIEYAYLDGEEGVMITQREGFEVDGLEIKARLVFGAGAIDYRGMYKNPGS